MSTYRPSADVVATQLDDDETVLLSLKTQQYYSLNETGSRVWKLLAEEQTVDEIAEAITVEWDTDYDAARTYVQSFIDELCDEGLVDQAPQAE